jgi:hypothetical protein
MAGLLSGLLLDVDLLARRFDLLHDAAEVMMAQVAGA